MHTEQSSQESLSIQLPPEGIVWKDVERELVRQAVERADGNQTMAAELLGLKRDALRRRLIKYGFLDKQQQVESVELAAAA